jgi:chemotaxis protein histidine kinase CheA
MPAPPEEAGAVPPSQTSTEGAAAAAPAAPEPGAAAATPAADEEPSGGATGGVPPAAASASAAGAEKDEEAEEASASSKPAAAEPTTTVEPAAVAPGATSSPAATEKVAVQKEPDEVRVTLWNNTLQRKVAGTAAPMARSLDDYLAEHPDCEVYTGQTRDKAQEQPASASSAGAVAAVPAAAGAGGNRSPKSSSPPAAAVVRADAAAQAAARQQVVAAQQAVAQQQVAAARAAKNAAAAQAVAEAAQLAAAQAAAVARLAELEEEEEIEQVAKPPAPDRVSLTVCDPDTLARCNLVLVSLMRTEGAASVFCTPIDKEQFPHYHEVMLRSMDFETIRKKLLGIADETGEPLRNNCSGYCSAEEFAVDVRLALLNCICFNDSVPCAADAPIVRLAQKLRAKFERLMDCWVKRPTSASAEDFRPRLDTAEDSCCVVCREKPRVSTLEDMYNIALCDGCDALYHVDCLPEGSMEEEDAPAGEWYCDYCVTHHHAPATPGAPPGAAFAKVCVECNAARETVQYCRVQCGHTAADWQSPPIVYEQVYPLRCEKRHLFLSVSLCLSQACLGKMFVFIYEWHLKNAVFRRHLPASTQEDLRIASLASYECPEGCGAIFSTQPAVVAHSMHCTAGQLKMRGAASAAAAAAAAAPAAAAENVCFTVDADAESPKAAAAAAEGSAVGDASWLCEWCGCDTQVRRKR